MGTKNFLPTAVGVLSVLGVIAVGVITLNDAAGHTDNLRKDHAAALQRATAAENDRDMLLACLNGRGALVARTGLKVEVTHCRTKTQTYQQQQVAGL